MNVRLLLAAVLLGATVGCIEPAPDSQDNNGLANNFQTNNGTNNGTNNTLNNNTLNNSNNQTNNGQTINVPEPWHNDAFGRRVRFDIDLSGTGGGFMGNLRVIEVPELVPANVEFRDFDGGVIDHDFDEGPSYSYWMGFDNAQSIWMYFDSTDRPPALRNAWGNTSMYHFGRSNIGYNANQSGGDLSCSGTCGVVQGIRGTAFASSGSALEIDTAGSHPANAARVTFIAWLGLPEIAEAGQVIMAAQGASDRCGWELVTNNTEMQLIVRNGAAGCAVVDTLSVSYPTSEAFVPLIVRIQRSEGTVRAALQLGDQAVQSDNLEVPQADVLQIGSSPYGQVDELQIIPAWVDDAIIDTHVRNLTDESAVIQNAVEFRP